MPKNKSTYEQRSRTFTGCGACRTRHLKCDEARPTCSSCRRLRVACSYAPRLLWISGDDKFTADGDTSGFRYPLFTEARRTSMSRATVHSLGGRDAGDALADLDNASDDVVVGPFGVFRSSSECSTEPDLQSQLILDSDREEIVPIDLHGELSSDWMDMDMSWPQPCDMLPIQDFTDSKGVIDTNTSATTGTETKFVSNVRHNRPMSPLGIATQHTLPQHASVLMQYLKSEVLQESPSKRDMSPWRLLLLPCALETIAEIVLWNTTSYARRSILSTLLAKSAYHLSKSHQPTGLFWYGVGQDYQKEAKQNLKSAIANEYETDAATKYPEMLMAFLSVGAVSTYFDDPQSIRKLLLDAEQFIRSRGLPSTKKLQHRVLHHMYTHLRIVLESTNVAAVDSQLVVSTIPRNFHITATDLGDLDLGRQKPEEIGYNDIHLDVTGTWTATLYPEVMGVSETLVTLLSKTISLVNEKPRLEAAGLHDSAVSMALSKHVKTLEQQIWSWTGPRDEKQPQLESMTLAMHQALIIFFYRRVYNTNVMIIQSQVKNTLEHVLQCLEMGKHDSDLAVSIAWSTFIAASEAVSEDLQDMGLKALKVVDDYGMFLEQGKPSTIAQAVWAHRDRTKDFAFGWPDLMSATSSPRISLVC